MTSQIDFIATLFGKLNFEQTFEAEVNSSHVTKSLFQLSRFSLSFLLKIKVSHGLLHKASSVNGSVQIYQLSIHSCVTSWSSTNRQVHAIMTS